jgi:ubiquinone/menaquinone biosynthesis C-methylase UbiE
MNKYEESSIKKYNKIAQKYDETSEGRFTAPFKEKLLEICEIKDGDAVLDVGCGNGDLISKI